MKDKQANAGEVYIEENVLGFVVVLMVAGFMWNSAGSTETASTSSRPSTSSRQKNLEATKARLVRQAASEFASSMSAIDANVSSAEAIFREVMHKATVAERLVLASEFDEAEALFAEAEGIFMEARAIADDAMTKATVVLAGNGSISDAWLAQLEHRVAVHQNRVSEWQMKAQKLESRVNQVASQLGLN